MRDHPERRSKIEGGEGRVSQNRTNLDRGSGGGRSSQIGRPFWGSVSDELLEAGAKSKDIEAS